MSAHVLCLLFWEPSVSRSKVWRINNVVLATEFEQTLEKESKKKSRHKSEKDNMYRILLRCARRANRWQILNRSFTEFEKKNSDRTMIDVSHLK